MPLHSSRCSQVFDRLFVLGRSDPRALGSWPLRSSTALGPRPLWSSAATTVMLLDKCLLVCMLARCLHVCLQVTGVLSCRCSDRSPRLGPLCLGLLCVGRFGSDVSASSAWAASARVSGLGALGSNLSARTTRLGPLGSASSGSAPRSGPPRLRPLASVSLARHPRTGPPRIGPFARSDTR